jgi:hypothetical protein
VRLVEAVAAEGLDLRRDLVDDLGREALGDGLLDELAELLLDELGVLLADGFAQHVGFGERDAREPLRDAHHLFLIGDDAVGRGEDLLELGELVGDRLLALLAALVDLVHAGIERAGAHERVGRDQVVEAVGAHGAHHVGGERRFELEHAGGAAGAEQAVGVLVVERQRVDVDVDAAPRLDRLHRVGDDRERGEAEEVHLEHPGLLERDHVVLRDHHALVAVAAARALRLGGADGDVVVERTRRDDDAGRVHTRVAREPFERDREVEELLVRARPGVELDLGDLLDRLGDGQREVGCVGNQLGDRVGLGRREAEHAADVLDAGARLERPECDDLSDRVAPVLVADVLDDLAAPFEAEVDVDVGHRDAFRIQEAFEEQVELERADVRDAGGVRDERPGGRAATRTNGDARSRAA